MYKIKLRVTTPIKLKLKKAPSIHIGTALAGPRGYQGAQGEQGESGDRVYSFEIRDGNLYVQYEEESP